MPHFDTSRFRLVGQTLVIALHRCGSPLSWNGDAVELMQMHFVPSVSCALCGESMACFRSRGSRGLGCFSLWGVFFISF